MANLNFFWQCEKKAKISLPGSATVGELRSKIEDQLRDDYDLDHEADVQLYLKTEEIVGDHRSIESCDIGNGSTVVVLSEAVAEEVAERSRIKCTKKAFDKLEREGGGDAEAQLSALQNAEPFEVCCQNIALGELGVGMPILFQFIAFLAILLLVLFVINLPSTAKYNYGEAIESWPVIPEGEYMSSGMLTAGNLGEDRTDSTLFGNVALMSGLAMLLMAAIFSKKIELIKKEVDVHEVDSSDFALFVEGLPENVVDEEEIKEWMEHNLIYGHDIEVVKVVIGYDLDEFNRKQTEVRDMRQQLAESKDPREKTTLQASVTKATLETFKPDLLGGTGYAVVVLRSQVDHREVLEEWSSLTETAARSFGSVFNGLSGKPKFVSNGEEFMLDVSRADMPSDIMWENLCVTSEERCQAKLRGSSVLFGIFLIAFFVILGGRVLQRKFHTEKYLAYIALTAIGLSTAVISMFSKKFVDKERHVTKTRRDVSLMLSYSGGHFINFNLALVLASFPAQEHWYGAKGLYHTVFMMQILTCIILAILTITNCPHKFSRIIVGLVTGQGAPSQTKLNKQYDLPTLDAAKCYANTFKIFFLGVMYLPVMPLGTLMCSIGLVGRYWSVKYHVVTDCKRMYRQSEALGYVAVRVVFGFAAVYGFAQWFFMSYTVTGFGETRCRTVMWILFLLSFVMVMLPHWAYQSLLCFIDKDEDVENIDYYDAQMTLAKHEKYHTTNPVYLWMEKFYAHPACKQPKPWELKTGNIPKPGMPAPPEDKSEPGPPPGALASVKMDAAPPAAGTVEDAATTAVEHDVDDDAPTETQAVGEADPAALALEEMKTRRALLHTDSEGEE